MDLLSKSLRSSGLGTAAGHTISRRPSRETPRRDDAVASEGHGVDGVIGDSIFESRCTGREGATRSSGIAAARSDHNQNTHDDNHGRPRRQSERFEGGAATNNPTSWSSGQPLAILVIARTPKAGRRRQSPLSPDRRDAPSAPRD